MTAFCYFDVGVVGEFHGICSVWSNVQPPVLRERKRGVPV